MTRIPTIPASLAAFTMLLGLLLVYWGATGLGLLTPKETTK